MSANQRPKKGGRPLARRLRARLFLVMVRDPDRWWTPEELVPFMRDLLLPEESLRRCPEREYGPTGRRRTLEERIERGHVSKVQETCMSATDGGSPGGGFEHRPATDEEPAAFRLPPDPWGWVFASPQRTGLVFNELYSLMQARRVAVGLEFTSVASTPRKSVAEVFGPAPEPDPGQSAREEASATE